MAWCQHALKGPYLGKVIHGGVREIPEEEEENARDEDEAAVGLLAGDVLLPRWGAAEV